MQPTVRRQRKHDSAVNVLPLVAGWLDIPQQVQLFNQAGLLPLQTLSDPVHLPGGKRQEVGEVRSYT